MVLAQRTLLHGSYEIVDVLGQGGFAVTYKARHIKLNTYHAIKEYFPRGTAERHKKSVQPAEGAENRDNFAKGLDSFLREAQTLTRFSHPNIVSVQDYFQENGTAYLVMPYLAGETLDAVLKKCPGSKMTVQGVKQWLLPLLDGLAALHAKNFLHRDIKPTNIYLTGNATPILIDFGAARSDMGQLTHGFTIVFTPEYAPPEQHTAIASSQGPWTDIYAVGAVMYRCLMGTPPPDSNTRQLAVIHGEKDPVEHACPALTAASDSQMARIVTRCLDLNSKTRIRSVRELQTLLKAALSGQDGGTQKPIIELKESVPAKDHHSGQSAHIELSGSVAGKKKNDNGGTIIAWLIGIILIFIVFISLYNKQSYTNKSSQSANTNSVQPDQNENFCSNMLSQLKNGENLYDKKDYHSAKMYLKECIRSACRRYENDRMRCANILGIIYENEGNYVSAVSMYQTAVEGGNNSARYNLAMCYRDGRTGVPKNPEKSLALFKEAAERGDAGAAAEVGRYYENSGENKRALEWYTRSLNNSVITDKTVKSAHERVQKKLLREALASGVVR